VTHKSDHADHSSVSSNEKEEGDLDGVRLVEVAGLDLLGDKLADQIILGFDHACIDEVAEIVQQTLRRRGRLTGGGRAVRANGDLASEELEILEWNAEDGVDDLGSTHAITYTHVGRKGESELLDKVDRGALLHHGIEEVVNGLLDVRAERLDVLGGEEPPNHGAAR